MTKHILIVDDDPHIREVIAFTLEKAGMSTAMAADGRQALCVQQETQPDLIVLDISMPELDGFDVCRTLRKKADTPILFLSSRDEEIDKIIGLEIGGDDYMTKPFSPRELLARINVILKRMRSTTPMSTEHKIIHGKLSLDPESYTADCDGLKVPLTATEFMLLRSLLASPHKVFTRNELMDCAYGSNISVSDRTIDSHIRRIRSKFSAAGVDTVIMTNHGIGYHLGQCL